jgi:serine protease Do
MSARSRLFLPILTVLALTACRREAPRLDPVQQMAYEVKPAVVRVSSVATAKFHYDPTSLDAVERWLIEERFRITRKAMSDSSVETGTGGSGSGFTVHPDGWILTSAHVVAPTRDQSVMERELRRNGAITVLLKQFPASVMRTLYDRGDLERHIESVAAAGRLDGIVTRNEVELSNGESHPYTVALFSAPNPQTGADVAVLRINRKDLPSIRLGDSDAVHLQEQVWAIGYPSVASSTDEVIGGWLSAETDLEATFNPGTITAVRRNVSNAQVFQSNVAIYPGNSGGPAVNRKGEVIAISTWGHTAAEQVKFLVPIRVARQLLEGAKIPVSADGRFNRAYRQAIQAAAEGDWQLAREQLAIAGKLFPNSPDVIRFRRDADTALSVKSPLASYSATAAASVAIVGALLALFSLARTARRRPRRVVLPALRSDIVIRPDRGGREDAELASAGLLGKLTVLNGERAGDRFGLGGSGIRIGREASVCEIVLDNPKVSRLHAEVVSLDGRVLLIDRNSSNGTFVNDQKVERRFLRDGDIIYFGGRNAIAVAFHVVSA